MPNSVVNRLSKYSRHHEFWLLSLILIIGLSLSMVSSSFLTVGNFLDLTTSYAMLGILSCGLFMVLVSGGIDISMTATASVAQYVMATVIINYGGNFILAFAVSGLVGIALGAINGLLIHYLKVPAIIITIATLNLFYGLLIYFTNGVWLYDFPDWFMDGIELVSWEAGGSFYSLSLPIMALSSAIALTWFIMNRTRVGRQIYALGGNADAALRIGFNVRKLQLFVYCYMGLMAGVAAVVQAQVVLSVAPNALVGFELSVVAAVVLGGASLKGGAGSVMGTVLGVVLIALMRNGLTLMGVSSYWHQVMTGAVILLSVIMTAMAERKKTGKGNFQCEATS